MLKIFLIHWHKPPHPLLNFLIVSGLKPSWSTPYFTNLSIVFCVIFSTLIAWRSFKNFERIARSYLLVDHWGRNPNKIQTQFITNLTASGGEFKALISAISCIVGMICSFSIEKGCSASLCCSCTKLFSISAKVSLNYLILASCASILSESFDEVALGDEGIEDFWEGKGFSLLTIFVLGSMLWCDSMCF